MTNNNDLAALWSIYQRCQSGEVSALDDLFIIKSNKDIQHTDTAGFHVGFKYECLSKILTSAKKRYSSEETNFSDNHKKYYSGEYDISDLDELMYLNVIELFRCNLNENRCATISGVTSTLPIVDAGTLIKNISFFMDKQLNERGRGAYLDIGYIIQDNDGDENEDEELSLLDKYSGKRWYESKGKSARGWIYADILNWFEKDIGAIYDLFNVDSFAIKAIIKTILECKDTFIDVDDEEDKCFVTQERLCEIVKIHTGKKIRKNNMPQCLDTIRLRIMDYFMFSLGSKFRRVFGRELMQLYKLCDSFQQEGWHYFIKRLRQYEDIVAPIIKTVSGKQMYDMINLLQDDMDVLDKPPDEVARDICDLLLAHLHKMEDNQVRTELERYSICDKYTLKKVRWNADLDEKKANIKIWTHEKIKYPKVITIGRDNLIVYEGLRNYYICDTQKTVAYCLPKLNRKIIKTNKSKIKLKNIA